MDWTPVEVAAAAAVDEVVTDADTVEDDEAGAVEDVEAEDEDTTVLEAAVDEADVEDATDDDETFGAGYRATFWNKVKVEEPPQFSVY